MQIALHKGPKVLINLGSQLYILTSMQKPVKVIGKKSVEECDEPLMKFFVVQSTIANAGNKIYMIDFEENLMLFNLSTEKLTIEGSVRVRS